MDIETLVNTFEVEGKRLNGVLRQHPTLRPFFTRNYHGTSIEVLRQTYLQLLKLKADYVRCTTPALKAAGNTLQKGDKEDQQWSLHFIGYAEDETDEVGGYGHQIWAQNDMKALGADSEFINTPAHPSVHAYERYFCEEVSRHPYAILGAKGVLENFSIRVSDDLVSAISASGIPQADQATTFFSHHGLLDIEHVREGNRKLGSLLHARKRQQVLEGALVTSAAYRNFIKEYFPS